MKRIEIFCFWILLLFVCRPEKAYADFWGGDLPLLTEIVVNTLQQLEELKTIIGTGSDTLGLLKDINSGLKDALGLIKTQNTTLTPGVLSDIQRIEDMMSTVQRLYGQVPNTSAATMEKTTDQSVAEAIYLHNEAFQYADSVDPEAERIKDYAKDVSPLGAGRLTAQSMGVVINVLNQVLRTNAAILKVQSEQLALQNRKEKQSSEQFKSMYENVGTALGASTGNYKLQ
jgi:hypothetical protein